MAANRDSSTKRILQVSVLLLVAAVILFALKYTFEAQISPVTHRILTERSDAIPIPETPWGLNAPEVQKHVEEFRERLEHLRADRDVTPIALANSYGKLGEIYLTYDLPPGAIACFRNAGRLDPGNFRWPYLQAMAHLTAVETEQAYRAMTEALEKLELDYSAGPEHHLAARCFLGDAALRLNKTDEAWQHFDEAIRLNSNSGFAHFRRGQLASRAGRSDLSVQDFLETLRLYSGSGVVPRPVCLALATEYQKLGRIEDAEKYRTLAESGPQDFVVNYVNPLMSEIRRLNQSSSYLRQAAEYELDRGNLEGALEKIATGLKGSPDSLKLRMLRVDVLLRMARTTDAIAELSEVRRLDEHGSTGRATLCELLARAPGTRHQALDEALRWQSDQPDSLIPRLTLAAVYFQLGQYQKARDLLEQAAQEYPAELSPQMGEVTAICALGEFDSAADRYQKLLQEFPQSPELRLHVARFLVTCPSEMQRNSGRSIHMLDELSATDDSLDVQETLACALAESGRFKEALELIARLESPLAAAGHSAQRHRLQRLRKSFEAGEPWRERWPFEVREEDHPVGSP